MTGKRPGIVTMGLLLVAAQSASAAPEADLWPYWQAHDPESETTVDHSHWARFLDAYLVVHENGANRVRYAQVDDYDKAVLEGYIAGLAEVEVTSLNRDEQFAFWVNLYNALTVKVILDHYPVDGIRSINISPGWFSRGPWGRKLVTVEGHELSLDDIEHRILRPVWQDPRIHYVVNCAAIGCPDLMARPYRALDLEVTLERQARRYVNDPRGMEFEDGRLTASRIYDWFQEDFGTDERDVIAHALEYAEKPLAAKLREADRIHRYRYDWSLNDVR